MVTSRYKDQSWKTFQLVTEILLDMNACQNVIAKVGLVIRSMVFAKHLSVKKDGLEIIVV